MWQLPRNCKKNQDSNMIITLSYRDSTMKLFKEGHSFFQGWSLLTLWHFIEKYLNRSWRIKDRRHFIFTYDLSFINPHTVKSRKNTMLVIMMIQILLPFRVKIISLFTKGYLWWFGCGFVGPGFRDPDNGGTIF